MTSIDTYILSYRVQTRALSSRALNLAVSAGKVVVG